MNEVAARTREDVLVDQSAERAQVEGTFLVNIGRTAVPKGWAAGPLPMAGTSLDGPVIADAENRGAVFTSTSRQLLYAADRRWHTETAGVGWTDDKGATTVQALELWGYPQRIGEVWPCILLVHVRSVAPSAGDLVSHLSRLIRRDNGRRRVLETLLQTGDALVALEPVPWIYSCLWFPAGVLGAGASNTALLVGASLESVEERPATPATLAMVAESRLDFSEDWSCLVLERGTSFVMVHDTAFADHARTYVTTIYSDALALVRLESLVVRLLSEAVARLDPDDWPGILRLDRASTEFRSSWWWPRASHSLIINDLVERLRSHVHLRASLDELGVSTRGLREALQARLAASAELTSRRSSAALGLLSVVGLPVGVVLTIWQSVGGTWPTLGWALAASAVLSGLLSLGSPVRGLFADLRGRPKR